MTRKSKLLCITAAMMAATFAFTGCGGDGGDKKGGNKVVRVAGTSSVIASLDPAKDWDGWYIVRYGVGETLFKLDEKLNPAPWIASKFEMVDTQTWKITLNDKVTFSNGQKVTAEKVIASLKRTGSMNSRASVLAKAEYKAEGNVITIKTEKPSPTLIHELCEPYATIIDVEGTKDFVKAPIGTGAFVMESFEPNKKAVMKKNENYWGGQVKVNTVEYSNVADANTIALALQNGEVDIALDMTPASAASIEKNDKVVLSKVTQPRVYQLYFNLNKLNDKAVREAIMYGIDKKTIGEKQLKGAVTPTVGAFLDSTPYSSKDLKARTFDPEKAKKILADAGYKDTNGDGIVEKDGKPLSIQLCTYKRLASDSIATEMQAQLKKIGIDIQIKGHEKATFFKPGDFDLGIYSIITLPTGDPYAVLRDAYKPDGVANYGKYTNDAITSYLEALSIEGDLAKRVDLVNKIQQQAIDDAGMDFIGFNNMYTGLSKSISGYNTAPNDYYQITKDLDKK